MKTIHGEMFNMKAKLVRIYGNIAIVVLTEDYKSVAYAVDKRHVSGLRVNEEFNISQDAVDAGTEYSIDWDIVIPEGFHISADKIHESLFARGIYTFDDYRNNQKEVHDALNVLIGEFQTQLSKLVNEINE